MASLDAFARFTEASSRTTDALTLATLARDVLRNVLGDVHVVYYEVQENRWVGRGFTEGMDQTFVQAAIQGFPDDAPGFQKPFEDHQVVFFDTWDAQREGADNTEMYRAGALYPYSHQDRPSALLTIGLVEDRRWTERERAVFQAVGRSLELAFERAQTISSLAAKSAEVEARNTVLSAFEDWTRDLTLSADPEALVQRAQTLLYRLLPIQATLYYQREGDRWFVRNMLGEYGSEGLRRAHEAGLPHEQTGNLRVPFETGKVVYLDPYRLETDGLAEHMTHVSATAMIPLNVGDQIHGVLGLARFGGETWTVIDRAIIETVAHSLELALDRASKAAELEDERAKLTARTAALATANEELEAFAYSVSHDLRTPVRHIAGFNKLLRNLVEGTLDSRAERYLTVVDEAAQRMNVLIDAMLNLSRTSRLPLRPGPVDLGALVQQARQEFEPDLIGREVRWDIEKLPLVMGDHDTLQQVMLNLLSNALKYTQPRDVAVIRVWAEERNTETAVFVKDNGVGFDTRYSDRLFAVFQRLHRQEEFEGVGVGLANVRRIIQRHGGTVFAHSLPGEGATFGFTLPGST